MASAKQKAIRARLEEIKTAASSMNASKTSSNRAFVTGSDLAEEAASLALELADLLESKGKDK